MQSAFLLYIEASILLFIPSLLWLQVSKKLRSTIKKSSLYYSSIILLMGYLIPIRIPIDIPFQSLASQQTDEMWLPVFRTSNQIMAGGFVNNPGSNPLETSTNWTLVFARIWFGVIVFIVGKYILYNIKNRRYYKRWCTPVKEEFLLETFEKAKLELGVSKNISLLHCPGITSPMLIDIFAPKLLLPTELNTNAIEHIYKHELIHYKRKDIGIKLMSLVVKCIHWFNPVVYLLVKQTDFYCELSCDEKTLAETSIVQRTDYSEAIIETAFATPIIRNSLSTNFNGGQKDMKQRIISIMDNKKKSQGKAIISLVLATIILLGYLSPINVNAKKPDVSTKIVSSTPKSNERLEVGTKIVPHSNYQRWAYIKKAFTFTDSAGNPTLPDLSKIEYWDAQTKEYVTASEVTVYQLKDLATENKPHMPYYNVSIIPNSENTEEKRLDYVRSNYLSSPDIKIEDIEKVINPYIRAVALENKIRTGAGMDRVKVNGEIFQVPALDSFVIKAEDEKKFDKFRELITTKSSTLYAGAGNENDDGILHVYTTNIEEFQKSEAMKVINDNGWRVTIRSVKLSNKDLETAKTKLDTNAEKYEIDNVQIMATTNSLIVESMNDSNANAAAMEKLTGIEDIVVFKNQKPS